MMVRLSQTKAPSVLPGSLITLRRKCGKASCRCAPGDPHESPALSYSVAGRTKMLTLRPVEVPAVARYRKSVNDLEVEARDELEGLVARVQARRKGQAR